MILFLIAVSGSIVSQSGLCPSSQATGLEVRSGCAQTVAKAVTSPARAVCSAAGCFFRAGREAVQSVGCRNCETLNASAGVNAGAVVTSTSSWSYEVYPPSPAPIVFPPLPPIESIPAVGVPLPAPPSAPTKASPVLDELKATPVASGQDFGVELKKLTNAISSIDQRLANLESKAAKSVSLPPSPPASSPAPPL